MGLCSPKRRDKTQPIGKPLGDGQSRLRTSIQPIDPFLSGGKLIRHFEVITPVLDAAAVFNLCKLKTHSFMVFTGAVKNNFGAIPGLHKPGYHAKLTPLLFILLIRPESGKQNFTLSRLPPHIFIPPG
jgi:hypothetical protein